MSGKAKAKTVIKNRFMELEGLRGIAAVVVVVYHFLLIFYLVAFFGNSATAPVQHAGIENNLFANPITGLLSGTFSVAIFFVLSGFVLSIGFFQTGKVDIVKKLAAKRYVRLMIPALASILICMLLIQLGVSRIQQAVAVTQSGVLAPAWSFSPTLIDAIKNGVIGIFVGVPNQYNGVLWTMSLEFTGSFIVFGVLLFAASSRYRWAVYGALILITINTWFFGFIVGMIFADLYSKGIIKQKARNWFAIAGLLSLGVYLGGFPLGSNFTATAYEPLVKLLPFQAVNYQIIYTLFGASIVVFVAIWSLQIASVLRFKWLGLLGKYTFSLYLVHVPILYTFTAAVFLQLHQHIGYNKAAILAFAVSIPVIGLATYFFEKYVDTNAIRFSSYLTAVFYGEKTLTFASWNRVQKWARNLLPKRQRQLSLDELEPVE